jgi:Pupal cuticle protein C1
MLRFTRLLTPALAALVVLFGAATVRADYFYTAPVVSSYYTPAPVVQSSYYYAPPVVTSYYAPAPVVRTSYYYAPPAVTTYYAPAPSYSYYSAPAVSTTTRYGIFGRPRYSVTTYYP